MTGPSTSNPKEKHRTLKFIVGYKDQTITIDLHENQSVVDLKRQIQGQTEIPICRQILLGWRKTPRTDSTSLSSLNLASETKLSLLGQEMNQEGSMETDE